VIESALFVDAARERGFGLWTGVPCLYLTSFLNEVISNRDLQYVAARNEGDAVAVAVGSVSSARPWRAVFPRACRDPRSHLPRGPGAFAITLPGSRRPDDADQSGAVTLTTRLAI
jgi:hypothetical protein